MNTVLTTELRRFTSEKSKDITRINVYANVHVQSDSCH